jgi:hypothetical protein
MVGALGTPWKFSKIFYFQCTTRGTKHHGNVVVINFGAIAPDQSSIPLGFAGLLFFPGEGPNIDTVPSLPCVEYNRK